MGAGVNTGRYSSGAQLPPRLATLMRRMGKGYADGGAVPQGPMPTPQQAGVAPQGQPPMSGADLQAVARQTVQANPQVGQQISQVLQEAIQSGRITPEQLNLVIETAKAVVQNPALYPRLRQMLIERGIATEADLPPQYDQGIIFAFLMMAEAAQGSQLATPPGGPRPGMAEGGSIPQSASPSNDKSGKADDINIRVSGGEYVIPKHIVAAKGTEFFDRMLEQYDPNNPDSKVNKPK